MNQCMASLRAHWTHTLANTILPTNSYGIFQSN